MGYSKLFNEIVLSTIWHEPDHVRIVWITMLAIKDRWHKINSSVPGLASIARVSIEQCEEALKILSSPDIYSRSKENEGRRIAECDGGWVVLNGEKYRNKMSLDERREYNRIKQREYRSKKYMSKSCVQSSTESAHTDTDTDSDTKEYIIKSKSPSELTTQFVDSLKSNPAYKHIHLEAELGKMDAWLSSRPGRKKTRRFVVNWLNKIEIPLEPQKSTNPWDYAEDFNKTYAEEAKNE